MKINPIVNAPYCQLWSVITWHHVRHISELFLSDACQPEVVFFRFLHGGFAESFGQIVSLVVKTFRNTNLVVSRCFKVEKKTSFPVGLRRSKTPLLKLPNYWCRKTMKRRPYWCPRPLLWELNLICTLLFQDKFVYRLATRVKTFNTFKPVNWHYLFTKARKWG